MFHISSSGIVDGRMDRRFGKFSSEHKDTVPTLSLPVSWSCVPEGIKSLALVMQDYDAVPVCGFSWLHWLVADIDPKLDGLMEGASRLNQDLIQGKNSLASRQICGDMPDELTCFYSGPCPPDADHEYEIRVFALDTILNLKKGFRYNELQRAMGGHILAVDMIFGWYPAKD